MTAFDSDVFTLITQGHEPYRVRLSQIAVGEQAIPLVVLEESIRGRLNSIRKAETAKQQQKIVSAYDRFFEVIADSHRYRVLPYTIAAHALFTAWRTAKIRIGTQDLRIAAICVVHGAKLITRNRRDYELVPGLPLEIWT